MSKQVTSDTPKLFIGLDIHKKSWKFHFTTDIVISRGRTFPLKSELVKRYVETNFLNYVVGCCGYKPARDFMSFDWNTYIVNPADIPYLSRINL